MSRIRPGRAVTQAQRTADLAAASGTYSPMSHRASQADVARSAPVFTRVGTTPLFTDADATLDSVYWPWPMKVAGLIGSPLAAYYLWSSTDHDAGAGGIELWTAPSPVGPWTSYGQVYVDVVSGTQTETPSVRWNAALTRFEMLYQQAGASGSIDQSTFLATSPDGVTWTRVGKAIDVQNATDQPGDGHTGYANPFFIGGQWAAYHLKGGSTYPHFGISYCPTDDWSAWVMDPRSLGYGAEWYAATGDRAVSWNHCTVFEYRGQRFALGIVSNFTAGAEPKDARLFIAPLSPDLRRFTGPPQLILAPTGTWESANLRACALLADGGSLYLYYQCDASVGVAVAGV